MKTVLQALVLVMLAASAAGAQTHLLIISGLGGEARYTTDFNAWSTAMYEAAQTRFGIPRENIVYLAEDPARDRARITAVSRKEEVERALRAIAGRAGPDDRVMILLIGHGSSDSRGSRINLPGPDLTAAELAAHLAAFRTQPVVVVNTASASGGWVEPLAGPNRAVISATRTATDRNATIFGKYFVEAFASDAADINQDGRVTIAEAYEYATRETERAYQTAGTLQTENARMEGNVELARSFHLGAPRGAAPANASAELRELFAQRQRLEQSIDALRGRSGQMETAAYEAELERLLLELARTTRAIQEMGGGT